MLIDFKYGKFPRGGDIMQKNFFYLILSTLIANIASSILYIGITWYVLTSVNGEILYGSIVLIATITGFAISNFIGKIIDRYNKKKIFILLHLIVSLLFLIIFLFLIRNIALSITTLFVSYMIISVYSMFYWNIILSITQQIFSIKEYKSINSKMEIIGQISSVFSIIAGFIIYSVNFLFIIIACSIAFAISAMIFKKIQIVDAEKNNPSQSTFSGFNYLKNNKNMFFLLFALYTPFIAIIIGNFTKPAFIVNTLNGTPVIIGAMESIYAISAVITSLLIPKMNEKNEFVLIIISMIVFSVGTIAMGLIKIVIIFLGLEAIQGYGNPAIRIIRKTIMMKTIPKKFIGRVYGSLETISYMARIAFLAIFILIIKYTGSGILIAIQGIFVLAFVFVVIYSFRKMQIKAQPDKNPKRFYLSGYYQKHR